MDVNLIFGIVGNILSSVGIVITNKYVTKGDGYEFMIFLSAMHFAFTALCLQVGVTFGVIAYKECSYREVAPIALFNMLSVAFMNLTLEKNSIGTYQLSKLVCIPITLIIQCIFYKVFVSRKIQMTLVVILFGVGYATVHDVEVNLLGTLYAIVAIIVTALCQIFTNTYQKSLGLDALQLLSKTAPLITLGMLLLCPLFDDVDELVAFEYTPALTSRIVVTCLFAVVVNGTNYYVLGKTSPLTYQIVGHLKTVLVFLLGFAFFNTELDYRNVLGILICLIGVFIYSEIKRKEAMEETSSKLNAAKAIHEEESALMLPKTSVV